MAAGAVITFKFLTNAIDYYCNVDEIGVRDGCEPGRRLRVQGTVQAGSVKQADGITTFAMMFNDAELAVRYEGEPGGIFDECVAVVVHGRLDADVFNGDRIEVKHSNEYSEKNSGRLSEASKNACATDPPAPGGEQAAAGRSPPG